MIFFDFILEKSGLFLVHWLFALAAIFIFPVSFLQAAEGVSLAGNSMNDVNDLYVSPTGNDTNPGTLNAPFRTVTKARDTIRNLHRPMSADIYVYLRGGEYDIGSPLVFTEADSGTNGHVIHYLAYKDEVPIISGGRQVTGWMPYKNDIYEVHLDRADKLRQLYVNGRRAFMARGKDFPFTSDVQGYGTFVITGNEPWALSSGTRFAGYTFNEKNLGPYANPGDVELCSKAGFGYHTISLSGIDTSGTKPVALLQQPIGAIAQCVPQVGCAFVSDKPGLKAVSEFHFQNALELLTTAGQFYYDRTSKKLYYDKRSDEDMSHAEVMVPVSEGLLVLKGSSTKHRVSHIAFNGITFAYDHYSLTKVANSYGDTAVQSVALYTKYLEKRESHQGLYSKVKVQRAAIECNNSDHIDFTNNVFEHLGEIGLSLGNDASNSKIIGNVFYDIGSAGMNVGDPKNTFIGDGDFPPDVEGIPTDDVVQNNYFKDLGVETLQAPGISIFYTTGLDFSHNEVYNTPYTGVSMGWGWIRFTRHSSPDHFSTSSANNKIDDNKIIDTLVKMHDGAAIYVLGDQPGSEIVGYYIGKVGGFSKGASIYLDQGSRYLRIINNYSDNPSGWFNIWGKAAQVYNITASGNYSFVIHGHEGKNLNDSPDFQNAHSQITDADRQNKQDAGLQAPYLGIKAKIDLNL
jgi:hypothetical protein